MAEHGQRLKKQKSAPKLQDLYTRTEHRCCTDCNQGRTTPKASCVQAWPRPRRDAEPRCAEQAEAQSGAALRIGEGPKEAYSLSATGASSSAHSKNTEGLQRGGEGGQKFCRKLAGAAAPPCRMGRSASVTWSVDAQLPRRP
ncbi:hypothetical protein EJB05_55518 [Eragrostis curvula]|uniref:Uncharacterized protein n=1 Tax=Eragrostis curvula TaxID=38414 RepID=A0A5J9SJK4_9POAL|nr:hypothetical protein EJB05_55518 [Eragrostis curvula]